MHVTTHKDQPICFLFDNGSLRAAATLGLRRLATALAVELAHEVRPVSLLHSSGVDRGELDGTPAELLEPALGRFFEAGGKTAILLPLFFGPSAALTEYVPERVAAVLQRFPDRRVQLAPPLVNVSDESDHRIAGLLADAVRATCTARALDRPAVLLTDHGTPQRSVSEVRNHLGRQLAEQLAAAGIACVGVASMERRDGVVYDFNEPLLERALGSAPFNTGDVVIALQFLQPGRHAGPNGDIAAICRSAEAANPGLRTHMSTPIGTPDARLLGLLKDRWDEALKANSDSAAR